MIDVVPGTLPAPPLATPPGLARVAFRAMGTDVEVLLPVGHEAAAAIVARTFAAWERHCSRFDPASELSRLNAAAGAPVLVSSGLFDAVATALDAARATDGVFDPTVLHRLEDLGYDRTFAEVAASEALAPSRTAPRPWAGAWTAVRLDRRTRTVEMPPGVGLDLGGIAKGMAVDAALAALVAAGLPAAAVNAGGDLAVHRAPPGADAWWIAVETPLGDVPVAVAEGALATSSTTRRRWARGGRELHHIVDPRTGSPATSGIASVSVAAHACAQAEVAAKVALVLGLADGTAFLERAGLSALLVGDAGDRHQVGRWLRPGDAADPSGDRDS